MNTNRLTNERDANQALASQAAQTIATRMARESERARWAAVLSKKGA